VEEEAIFIIIFSFAVEVANFCSVRVVANFCFAGGFEG
jgi:hypothetical protein